ncbi:hypothetical protein ZHAS_00002744 [Anopheles sinensis]|uniref:Uncharacterized protein n=1 Tax=Anopheles sinensis TaxID=74873 RepID=A0A084VCX4_ANOSI|nr:hypothetical protein ZHAS_00002744 [Anopheles sinensis]
MRDKNKKLLNSAAFATMELKQKATQRLPQPAPEHLGKGAAGARFHVSSRDVLSCRSHELP